MALLELPPSAYPEAGIPDFASDLVAVMEKVYSEALGDAAYIFGEGAYDLKTIHRAPLCHLVSSGVACGFMDNGYTACNVTVVRPFEGIRQHSCARVVLAGREVIIDPTWQQFLEGDIGASLPKFLYGSPTDIRAQAVEWGVAPDKAALLWPDTLVTAG